MSTFEIANHDLNMLPSLPFVCLNSLICVTSPVVAPCGFVLLPGLSVMDLQVMAQQALWTGAEPDEEEEVVAEQVVDTPGDDDWHEAEDGETADLMEAGGMATTSSSSSSSQALPPPVPPGDRSGGDGPELEPLPAPPSPIRRPFLRAAQCPHACECGGDEAGCTGTCSDQQGHEGIHVCQNCFVSQTRRLEQMGGVVETPYLPEPEAPPPPMPMVRRRHWDHPYAVEVMPAGVAAAASSAAAAPSQARGLRAGRCTAECAVKHVVCVRQCGQAQDHDGPHSCWACRVYGEGFRQGQLRRTEAKLGYLQRSQRDDVVMAYSADVCHQCGSTAKSTTGSNSYYFRIKCAVCGHVFRRVPVLWPRSAEWLAQIMRGFNMRG